jgi:diguanylate cyclase (GGDEF)-like protein/PAS domain S-box-containing protein
VLIVLLAATTGLSVWRAHNDQQQRARLEHTSAAATALQHARAQFFLEAGAATAQALIRDPIVPERYERAAAELREDLSYARAELIASGKTDDVAALDALAERIDSIEATIQAGMPIFQTGDQEDILALASAAWPQVWPNVDAAMNELETLATAQQNKVIADAAAANRAADTTLALLIGLSAAGFLVAAGTVAMLILSVVWPLAALRASARAITSGDLEARAKVSGPEEVASLAHDFNEMTDALSAKTEEYLTTANLTGVTLLRLDKDGRCVFLNDATCQFLGRPREEILGAEIARYLYPDDVEPATQTLREMIKSREPILGVVSRYVTPMGIKVAEWNAHPLFDEQNRYAGLQGTSRDITERRQMEEALRESEERYRSLVANTPDVVWTTDSEGNTSFISPNVEQIFGYTPQEICEGGDRVWFGRIHPDDIEKVKRAYETLLAEGKRYDVEYRIKRRDGRWIWLNDRAIATRKEAGRLRADGVFSDITERKRAEEALQESEEAFRLLFENAKDAIFHADPATGLITKCNRAAETLLEKDREEIIGQPQATIHPPQKAEHYIQMFKRHMEQQGFVEDEAEVITKSGKTKPVLITASVASVRGTPIIQGAFRDITERKRLEEERERLHAELEERAITDGLTGLYNHAHFYQRLAEEIDRSKRYGRSFSILMMDVDKFKQFNDTRGHQAGDVALRLIADCVRAGLRRSDLPFRYGGDEFATILLNADSSRAQTVVNRTNRRIATSLKHLDDPAAAWLGLSAGVASFPQDGITPDDLVRIADAALYDAKRVTQARSAIEKAQAAWPLATARAAGRRKD